MELVGVKAEETEDRVRRRPVNHLREPLKVNIKVLKPNLLLKLSYFSRVSCQTAAVVKPGGVVSLTTVKDKCSSSNKPQRDSPVVPMCCKRRETCLHSAWNDALSKKSDTTSVLGGFSRFIGILTTVPMGTVA